MLTYGFLVIAGFMTGGSLAIRGGFRQARNSAIMCGIFLAVIEGVGIGFQRMMADNTRLDVGIPLRQDWPATMASLLVYESVKGDSNTNTLTDSSTTSAAITRRLRAVVANACCLMRLLYCNPKISLAKIPPFCGPKPFSHRSFSALRITVRLSLQWRYEAFIFGHIGRKAREFSTGIDFKEINGCESRIAECHIQKG